MQGGDFLAKIAACLVLFSLPFSLFSFLSPHRPPAMRCRGGGMPRPYIHVRYCLPPLIRSLRDHIVEVRLPPAVMDISIRCAGHDPTQGKPFLRRTNSPLLRKFLIFLFSSLFALLSSLKKPAHAGNSAWADRVVSDIRFSSSGAGGTASLPYPLRSGSGRSSERSRPWGRRWPESRCRAWRAR